MKANRTSRRTTVSIFLTMAFFGSAALPAAAGVMLGKTGAVKSRGQELSRAVAASEELTKPSSPTGLEVGFLGIGYAFVTSGASSSIGNPTECRFDWGDGTFSSWSGLTTGSHAWSVHGVYWITAEGRAATLPGLTVKSVAHRIVISGPGDISPYAGKGKLGPGVVGDGVLATDARLNFPHGIALDAAGNLFIADTSDQRIRKVTASTGIITTVAGTGTAGYSGDGGPATSAKISNPSAVAFDAAGNLYIADSSNSRVRVVNAVTGLIATVAGTGTVGFSGDNGSATSAQLSYPSGIAVDASGSVYIADYSNHRIRCVGAATHIITTVAGTGTAGYNADGIAATSAQLNFPKGLAIDGSGDLYVAEYIGHRVRKVVRATGLISTVAGTGTAGYNGDGIAATTAQLNAPQGVFVDPSGTIYIAEDISSRVRKVVAGPMLISTIAGDGGYGYNGDGILASTAELNKPTSVVVGPSGDVFIADTSNYCVRRILP